MSDKSDKGKRKMSKNQTSKQSQKQDKGAPTKKPATRKPGTGGPFGEYVSHSSVAGDVLKGIRPQTRKTPPGT